MKMITYWRRSVADAQIHEGVTDEKDFRSATNEEWSNGKINAKLTNALFSDAGAKEDDDQIRILVCAHIYRRRTDHASKIRDDKPPVFSAIAFACSLSREGHLSKAEQPVVPRRLLEPIDPIRLVIGKIESFDKFITNNPVPNSVAAPPPWHEIVDYSDSLFSAVCLNKKAFTEYELLSHVCCRALGAGGDMTTHILGLYDLILVEKEKLDVPLLTKAAKTTTDSVRAPVDSIEAACAHVGHMSPVYPLAQAQRDALSHFLKISNGEILAVNGPPGTGKTTMIQGIVATLWVQAALEKKDPPVIVAASAGNQAVTNIITSFGKIEERDDDPLAGRWLPDVNSYGSYFPSVSRLKTDAAKYQTSEFFASIESDEFVSKAEAFFWEQYKKAFPGAPSGDISAAADHIHQQMMIDRGIIHNAKRIWGERKHLLAELERLAGIDPEGEINRMESSLQHLKQELERWHSAIKEWEKYLTHESFLLVLFNFIPAVARHRIRVAEIFLKNLTGRPKWNIQESVHEVDGLLEAEEKNIERQIGEVEELLGQVKGAKISFEDADCAWSATLCAVGLDSPNDFVAFNRKADIVIRYRLFQCATHYWEAMWLKEVRETILSGDPDNKAPERQFRRWRRYAKLTPCIVSTFHMLPSHFKAWRGVSIPLYNFIDLLIVDEAGQVTPEISAPSFALAQKALIVGDTKQIEPVWNISEIIDRGNLVGEGIMDAQSPERFSILDAIGCPASTGSLMKMAQNASPYHYDPDLDRGMMLYEHHRCLDDIISYCNQLCYKGKLVPKRGAAKSDRILAPLSYAHVSSRSETASGGSRFNTTEAEAIAEWITANREEWEAHYQKPIDEIVGIVTPFSAQAFRVKQYLSKGTKAEANITVGTVHALQGAERPIVVFSPVYSKHDIGGTFFFDRGVNMLNVAVSRAKDVFCVIGDMDIFDPRSTSRPSGLLAKMLFDGSDNRLQVEQPVRSDLLDGSLQEGGRSTITTLSEHEDVLREIIKEARAEIVIVSPWVTENALEASEIVPHIRDAVTRGVSVRVFGDKERTTASTGALNILKDAGCEVAVIPRVHSKIAIQDDKILCVGSFNWLSASRDERWCNLEVSFVQRGARVAEEKESILQCLSGRG